MSRLPTGSVRNGFGLLGILDPLEGSIGALWGGAPTDGPHKDLRNRAEVMLVFPGGSTISSGKGLRSCTVLDLRYSRTRWGWGRR